VSGLRAGDLDGAVVALESDVGGLEHAEIGRDELVLAVPRGHALARSPEPVRASELDGESVLLLADGHCFRDQALAFCSRAGADELGFRATSLSTLAQMAAGGAGVTLLPRLSVPTENRRHALVVRPFAPPVPARTLVLVWRLRSPLAVALKPLAAALGGSFRRVAAARA
jgi:LysR family hydrogen peroxide-inducible transcriptional activator